MRSRILFDENKLKQGLYQQEEDFASKSNGGGWPKDTWFQKRLSYVRVREQQRKKVAEADFVYECALGTITVRQSNGGY